ncbi:MULTISPECIES: TonB-dependent siderophore receptor [Pseudoalteromonas]|uniref:TonB-dependent siderophore receptor n=1 Tax=Pseudoalteromonas TaxID=53246 RepID=UPI0002EA5900|nr:MULTISPECIES: TonB-dependent siderophore receptor [Pseudoalteromonas]MCF6143871.1 iron complex outermembrane recepter protein [Pseudoalteromonas mariniglutinosa NCIMB 1770]BDF93354.1 ferrisiderophore receptor [Pseudoalteromonas sp. KAN5]
MKPTRPILVFPKPLSAITLALIAVNSISISYAKSNQPSQLKAVTVNADADQETATGPVDGFIARKSVTATKTDTPLIETPQSISIVTADKIEAIGATRVTEALAYTAGVNTSPWGDLPQYDWLYIRGFDAYAPGFYQDGLQIRNSGNWGIWQTEPYGMERIEVLKGPASVLYGQNGPGGVVNLVSKMPTPFSHNELQVKVGNYELKQIAVDMSGPLDDDSEYLYRFTGLTKDAELSTESLENDRDYLALSLTWQPSTQGKITFYSQYYNVDAGAAWHAYPLEGTLLPNPNGDIAISTLIGEPDFNRYKQEQWVVGYQGEYHFNNNWQLQQHSRYAKFNVDYGVIWGKWAQKNSDPHSADNFRYLKRTPLSSQETVTGLAIDTRLIGKINTGKLQHTILLGIDYQDTEIDVAARYGGVLDDLDIFAPNYGSEVIQPEPNIAGISTLAQVGVYLQDQIKFDDKWIMTLAGRWDRAEIKNETPDGIIDPTSQRTDTEFTARAGLVYLADNGLAPYISYSESFAPTTNVDPQQGRPFSPETGRQYEVGVRYQPFDTAASYSMAAFDIERSDFTQWVWTTEPAGFKQTGAIEVRGVELEALVQPTSRTNITAAYSWIPTAEVTESGNTIEIGKQDKAISEHQFSVWGDYRFADVFTVGLGARYTGSNYGTGEKAPIAVDSYTLLDAMLSYDLAQWKLALNVRNLTDKTVITTCGSTSCSYGDRRKVALTATYQW